MRRPSGVTWIAVAVAAAVLALLAVALWTQIGTDDAPDDASFEGVELAELLANPERYDGNTITVVAPVGAILHRNAFLVGAEEAPNGLLVVAEADAEGLALVEEGEVIRATGDVEILTPGVTNEFADLEQDIGFDIPDSFSGGPMMVASVIEAEEA